MKGIRTSIKVLALLAVMAMALVGAYPAETEASAELGDFCPASCEDTCGVNPATGHTFRLRDTSLE